MATEPKRARSRSYTVARVLARVVLHTLYPTRFYGKENINIDAPFIAVSNHSLWADPLAVAVQCKRYEIRFLGKRELAKTPSLYRLLVGGARMIPVNRGNYDMTAMRACLRTLRDGHPLGIFPEGTRHHEGFMENLESGLAVIAYRARVPLVPVLIEPGLRLFRMARVYIGKPIPMDGFYEKSMDHALMNDITAHISSWFVEMRKNPERFL